MIRKWENKYIIWIYKFTIGTLDEKTGVLKMDCVTTKRSLYINGKFMALKRLDSTTFNGNNNNTSNK
jgi:hypothetical protein